MRMSSWSIRAPLKSGSNASPNNPQQTTEIQLDELRALCARNEWEIVGEFIDEGISGSKGRDQRPGLDGMMRGIVRRDFELVSGPISGTSRFLTKTIAGNPGLSLKQ